MEMADFWANLDKAVNWIIVVAVPTVGFILSRLQRVRAKLLEERVKLAEKLQYDKTLEIIEGERKLFGTEREELKQQLEEMEQTLVRLRAENAAAEQIASQKERIRQQKALTGYIDDVIDKLMKYASIPIPKDAVEQEKWMSMFLPGTPEEMKESLKAMLRRKQ